MNGVLESYQRRKEILLLELSQQLPFEMVIADFIEGSFFIS